MTTIVAPTQSDIDALVAPWPGVAFAVGYASSSFASSTPKYGNIYYAGSAQNQFGTALALDGSTLFEIASLTKTFTATLYAHEIRRKNATRKLGDYSSDLQIGQQFAGILLDSLVNFTSGLPNDDRQTPTDQPPYLPFPYSEEGMLSFLKVTSMTPVKSGARYTYSSLAFALMAAVLGSHHRPHASVRTYEKLVREHIFEPLGMASIFFDDASLLRLVQGYDALFGSNAPVAPGHPQFPAYHGAGGIVASPSDMWQWLLFNMGTITNTKLSPLLNDIQSPSTDVTMSNGTQLGLGWFISSPVGALPAMVWSDGWIDGFTSYLGFLPWTSGSTPSEAGVFVLANASHLYGGYGQEAVAIIAHEVLALMVGGDAAAGV